MIHLGDPIDHCSRLVRRLDRIGPPGALFIGVAGFFLLSMRQSFTVPGAYGLSLAQLLLLGGALLWVMAWLSGLARGPESPLVMAAALGCLCASLFSYGRGMGRGLPIEVRTAVDHYTLNEVWSVAIVVLLLVVLRNERGLRVAIAGLVIGGAVSAMFAVIQVGTGIDLAPMFRLPGLKADDSVLVSNLMRNGIDRPQGSAGHPLELSAVLTVLVPLAIGLFLNARARRARSWPWALCVLIIGAGALVTVSRSAAIGVIAALVIMCWRWPLTRLAGLLVTAIAGLAIGVATQIKVLTALVQTFVGSSTDPSIRSRQNGIAYVTSHYRDHFWFGQGTGSYPASDNPVLDNQYLSRLMESGAVGLVTMVFAFAIGLILAVRSSTASDAATAELGSGISGAAAALIVIATILDTGGFVQISTLIWMIIALAGVACRLAGRQRAAQSVPDFGAIKV
jgi:putative inorganic carbon (HCO3(-)) transporter